MRLAIVEQTQRHHEHNGLDGLLADEGIIITIVVAAVCVVSSWLL
jgi:hypothetical protein